MADDVIDLHLMSSLLLNREKGGLRFLDEADGKMQKRIKSLSPEDMHVRASQRSSQILDNAGIPGLSYVASLLRASDMTAVESHSQTQTQLDEILNRLETLESFNMGHRLEALESRMESSLVLKEEFDLRVEQRLDVLEASLAQEKETKLCIKQKVEEDREAWHSGARKLSSKVVSLDDAVRQLQEQSEQLKQIVELEATKLESLEKTSGELAAVAGTEKEAGTKRQVGLPSKEVSPSQIGRRSLHTTEVLGQMPRLSETRHDTHVPPNKRNTTTWHPMFGDTLRAVAKSPQTSGRGTSC